MDEEELYDGRVIRIAKSPRSVAPYLGRPRIDDFALTSEDKAEAIAKGRPARLSVFDRDRTTIRQCLKIRGLEIEGSVAFQLLVSAIGDISFPESRGLPALRVLRDPLPSSLPGADGHCGIEGLERKPGIPKSVFRDLRSRLVDAATFVQEESGGET